MRHPAVRYGVALVAVGLATLVKVLVDPTADLPFLAYFGAVVVAAWFGGLGPGLVATGVSALLAAYLFFPSITSAIHALRLGLFVLEAVLISYLSDSLLRAERRVSSELAERSRTESRLRTVFDSNVIGIVFWNEGGAITEANDALLSMLGRTRADLRQGRLSWRDAVAPACIPLHVAAIEEIRAKGACAPFESEVVRPDGTRLPILCGGAAVDEPFAGRGITWLVDITAQKRLENELRDSAAVIETVNRVGHRLSAELDLERLVQEVTDAGTGLSGARFGAFFHNRVDAEGESYVLYTLSGVPREAFAGFTMPRNTALFGTTFRGEGVVRLADVTKDPRYGRNPPYQGMPPGHLPVASFMAVPVVSRAGDVLGGLFFGHPEPGVFTERHERLVVGLAAQAAVAIDNARLVEAAQRARAVAEEASRAKDEFLSVVSHELRTPISSMLNWVKVLQRGNTEKDERVERALASMERSTRIQTKLIDDLLDVSRIVTGRMRLEPRPVSLSTAVRAALDAIAPAAEAKGVRLEATLDGEGCRVAGDADRLQQVAWNLLSNAVKFTPAGGLVQVHVEAGGGGARLVVRDTGRGIARAFLPYVFERFRQADAAATRTQSGLGLGLAIVRHLTELHGGVVRVESTGEDQGATFTVTLPLLPGAPGEEQAVG